MATDNIYVVGGLAFSATKFVNDTWMPFLRAGYSDGGGALLKASVGTGVGYYFSESRVCWALA